MFLAFRRAKDGRACNRRAALLERWPASGADLEALLGVLHASMKLTDLRAIPQLHIDLAERDDRVEVKIEYRAVGVRAIATDSSGSAVDHPDLVCGMIITEIEGA